MKVPQKRNQVQWVREMGIDLGKLKCTQFETRKVSTIRSLEIKLRLNFFHISVSRFPVPLWLKIKKIFFLILLWFSSNVIAFFASIVFMTRKAWNVGQHKSSTNTQTGFMGIRCLAAFETWWKNPCNKKYYNIQF